MADLVVYSKEFRLLRQRGQQSQAERHGLGAQPIFDLTTGMTPKMFQGAADIYRFVAGTAIGEWKV